MNRNSHLLHKKQTLLVVDDDPNALTSYRIALNTAGFKDVLTCQDSRLVEQILKRHNIDLVLLDMIMPYVTGSDLLSFICTYYPEVPVIITTGIDDVNTAVKSLHSGAFDYLLKPVDVDRLNNSISKALELKIVREENRALANRLKQGQLEIPNAFDRFICRSKVMFSVFQYCEVIGKSHSPVLITGETGVGKEIIAKAIHDISGRKGQFVAVNMAGLDEPVVNDTLFGHIKGGFTGADTKRPGLVEKAANGSVFLDEIGDLDTNSQVKLLRLLQEKEYYPVGSDSIKKTNSRFIVATHADLEKMQQDGDFRKDLFYRLRVHHVHIPPLRERKEDIQPLFEHFLQLASAELNKTTPHYPQELINLLEVYSFPGNARELQSIVYEAISKHTSKTLSTTVFRERILQKKDPLFEKDPNIDNTEWISSLEELPTLKEAAHLLIDEAMKRAGNNQKTASGLLGISHQALNKRLNRMKEG